MIWQNPWAWLGLLTLALPVLIHLLSRRSARVQDFPSLRFLHTSQLLPARRARLTEPLLLIVRCAILAAATAALAQPLLLTTNRERDLGRALARAIVIDTSASMRRATAGGGSALAAARARAARVLGEATTGVLLETAAPARALAGAAAWLDTRQGRREVVIISDFQAGAIAASDLARLPATLGVQLERIDASRSNAPLEVSARRQGQETVARITLTGERTDVEWTVRQAGAGANYAELQLLAGAAESGRADAAKQAAMAVGASLETDSLHPVTIVYPGSASRAELLRAAQPLSQPWLADIVARVRRDSAFAAAASGAVVPADTLRNTNMIVLARNATGAPVARAAQVVNEGRAGLMLFALVDPGSLASAALIAAVGRAAATAPPVGELEPAVVPAEILERWQRPPAPYKPVRTPAGASDGRWFWVLALVLLGAETWLRRSRRPAITAASEESPHERVA